HSHAYFMSVAHLYFSFFFNDTATTEIYTLSLHDALPILSCRLTGRRGISDAARSRVEYATVGYDQCTCFAIATIPWRCSDQPRHYQWRKREWGHYIFIATRD